MEICVSENFGEQGHHRESSCPNLQRRPGPHLSPPWCRTGTATHISRPGALVSKNWSPQPHRAPSTHGVGGLKGNWGTCLCSQPTHLLRQGLGTEKGWEGWGRRENSKRKEPASKVQLSPSQTDHIQAALAEGDRGSSHTSTECEGQACL